MSNSFNNQPKTKPSQFPQYPQGRSNERMQTYAPNFQVPTSIPQGDPYTYPTMSGQKGLLEMQLKKNQQSSRQEDQNIRNQGIHSQFHTHSLQGGPNAQNWISQQRNQSSGVKGPTDSYYLLKDFDALSLGSQQGNTHSSFSNPHGYLLLPNIDAQSGTYQQKNQFSSKKDLVASSRLEENIEIQSLISNQIYKNPNLKPNTDQKAFDPVIPADPNEFSRTYAPINSTPSRLKATLVKKFLKQTEPTKEIQEIVRKASNFVGEVFFEGHRRGGCFQISPELVILPRHVIQGIEIYYLEITFKDSLGNSQLCRAQLAIEEDAKLDYAIVRLKSRRLEDANFLPFSQDIDLDELLLLHYPLDSDLSVSCHAILEKNYNEVILETFHDTNYGSSGGVYLNANGEAVAIHLGCLPDFGDTNRGRLGCTFKGIKAERQESILNENYHSESFRAKKMHFFLTKVDYYFDLEGKKFTKLLESYTKKLSKKQALEAAIKDAKQQGGKYKFVKEYSRLKKVEADHFPPKSVYKYALHLNIQILKENDMAALALEYQDHRDFDTTGSSKESKATRKVMENYFLAGNYFKAIEYNLKLYEKKDFIYKDNKEGIIEALKVHVENGLINLKQMKVLMTTFRLNSK